MKHCDLAVIGTGPAGQKAAIQAAKLDKKVVIVEKANAVGGTAINTGTIPSKALREAVLHLTGHGKRGLFGDSYRVKRNITIADLIAVSQQVIHNELEVIRDAFDRNGVELIWGHAHFEGPNLLQITRDSETDLITADKFVIATGTRPAKPASVPFNGRTIFCSDNVLKLDHVPKSMIVVGGGVIGTEYACIMATLGVRVTLVEGRHQVLSFLDREIAEAFQYHLRRMGVTLRLGEKVEGIEQLPPDNGSSALVQATLESGKKLHAATLLYAVGRQGTCQALQLENVGLEHNNRQRLQVDENYQTAVEHIYAAGDVIGFPALASTAMEQGRLAVCHAFGIKTDCFPELFPLGIYGVPEISMVGKTEEQLTDQGIPYEAGVALYKELARGQLLGDDIGMLKLLIHQDNRKILGIHCIGTGATELIHIGQAVMAFDGTVDFFIHNVFNYPTLAEAYKVAALNGTNKLQHV
ncbi:MAG: Si-specific NAD(P)(+) transhydrogenase [Phycisphaeraceae bacterium]